MRVSKPDNDLKEQFIREEIEKHPGATNKEINDSVRKKFAVGTSLPRIARIRAAVMTKTPDEAFLIAARNMQKAMLDTSFKYLSFERKEGKVDVRWKKTIVTVQEGGI